MVRFIMAALAVAGAWLLPATASAESEGFATTDVNMRAGPSTEYPRITVLPRGGQLYVYGCVREYTWCDVGYYDYRGWVSSRYISLFYDDRRVYVPYRPRVAVPIITFNFGYWDTWYPRYPWYRDYRWRRTYPGPDYYRERRRDNDVTIYAPDRRRNDFETRRNDAERIRPRNDQVIIPRDRDRRDRVEERRNRSEERVERRNRNNDQRVRERRERREDTRERRERREETRPRNRREQERPRERGERRNNTILGDCLEGRCLTNRR